MSNRRSIFASTRSTLTCAAGGGTFSSIGAMISSGSSAVLSHDISAVCGTDLRNTGHFFARSLSWTTMTGITPTILDNLPPSDSPRTRPLFLLLLLRLLQRLLTIVNAPLDLPLRPQLVLLPTEILNQQAIRLVLLVDAVLDRFDVRSKLLGLHVLDFLPVRAVEVVHHSLFFRRVLVAGPAAGESGLTHGVLGAWDLVDAARIVHGDEWFLFGHGVSCGVPGRVVWSSFVQLLCKVKLEVAVPDLDVDAEVAVIGGAVDDGAS